MLKFYLFVLKQVLNELCGYQYNPREHTQTSYSRFIYVDEKLVEKAVIDWLVIHPQLRFRQ